MQQATKLLKNPFNYYGGKNKLISQIFPLLPNRINTFYDIFGGGGDISFNVFANKIVYNDKSTEIVSVLKNLDDNFILELDNIIRKYNLSKTNKDGYIKLKEYYNSNKNSLSEREKALYFYALICHSFNNQYGFNRSREFNVPFGKNRSSFNSSMRNKLSDYIERINMNNNITFLSYDFKDFDYSQIKKGDFVYFDPPYYITTGAYERDYDLRWNENNERELYLILDYLSDRGIKWALSNVTEHKGRINNILNFFGTKYNVYPLNINYSNCSYQSKNREKKTQEVLLTNY